jgi:hypothetical protein
MPLLDPGDRPTIPAFFPESNLCLVFERKGKKKGEEEGEKK